MIRFLAAALILFSAGTSGATVCSQPQVPENGHVIFPTAGPLHPGTVVKYKCDIGFVHLGVEERSCQKDGSWSHQPPICAVNVALYKPASQSSTNRELAANFSTDGVLEGKCSRTEREPSSWWQVDLLQEYEIYAVELFIEESPRSGEERESGSDLEIRIGQHPASSNRENPLCFRHKGTLEKDQLHTFVCGSRITGRYVTILGKNRQLRLCEVFVLSTSSASSWQCGTLPNMESWDVFHSRCYHSSREALPWFSANTHCRMSGASLPIHVSDTEQIFMASQLRSRSPSDAQFYWIGLVSSPQDGAWRWTDGTVALKSETEWADPGAQEVSVSSPGSAYSVTLASPFAWKWIPALQALWYHWICNSKPLFCSSPGVPAGGGVMLSTQTYGIGTNAYYYCNYGFALQGSETRTCQDNGTWSEAPPVCYAINCGTPDTVMNGYVRLLNGSTVFGSLSEYKCQLGFKVSGRHLRVCHADGTWSGTPPSCKEIDCGPPDEVGNGTVVLNGNGTWMGSVAEYACNSGFRIVGSAVRHCSEAATWTPAAPTCYDAGSLRHVLVEEASPTPHWEHQTNLMTGFIVAVVILLVLIFLVIFWMWKKKKLYDTFSLSTVYATPTNGSTSGGNKDVLYAYTNASLATDDTTTYYSAVPVGERMLVSVETQNTDNRRLSILSASDLYYTASDVNCNEVSGTGNDQRNAAESLGSSSTDSAPGQLQVELPPQLLKLQQLPNGNIHLTLPCLRHAPAKTRPSIPFSSNSFRSTAITRTDSAKTGPLPRLPRRQPRQKKFNTMVGFVRKKISEKTATMKVTRPERRKRPALPIANASDRLTISSPIPQNETFPNSADSRTSPTPTEILFSFDYDGDEIEDDSGCLEIPQETENSNPEPANSVSLSASDSAQPIYDIPPELQQKKALFPPQTGENGYLKSRSASVKTREDNENQSESNIYEEVRARQVLTLESSGFELAHTYC